MFRFLVLLALLVLPLSSLAKKHLVYGVLPMRHTVEASQRLADFATTKIMERLRGKGAQVVKESQVNEAMKEAGIEEGAICDASCMVALGKALGADRVLAGTVRLESKKTGPGQVWELEVEQVRVKEKDSFGSFKRVCTCGPTLQKYLIGQLVTRALAYHHGIRDLPLKNPAPMTVPPDAPKEPGMAYVPAGEFIMGSDRGQPDEEPRHVVYTDPFFIDLYEVTNEKYDRCVAARKCQQSTTRSKKEMNGPKQPVAGVGWKDAQNYCAFAGKRLLTEAEWEKAARGTDERSYPWGNEWHDDWANQAWDKDGFTHSAPVGSFPQNVSPYGVYDMAGNVWEWTQDYHSYIYYRSSPRENPKGPRYGDKDGRRVMRGGSWMYSVPFFLRSHNRSPGRPFIRKKWVGIRCGKDAPK